MSLFPGDPLFGPATEDPRARVRVVDGEIRIESPEVAASGDRALSEDESLVSDLERRRTASTSTGSRLSTAGVLVVAAIVGAVLWYRYFRK